MRMLGFLMILTLLILSGGCTPDPLDPRPIGVSDGWEVIHTAPLGYDLHGIWGSAADRIWVVGDYGTIAHWNHDSLQRVDSPTRSHLCAIDGRSRGDIYAVGESEIIHFDGYLWRLLAAFPDDDLHDVVCLDDGRVYVVGESGLRKWDGLAWSDIPDTPPRARAVWLADDDRVRVGAHEGVWLLGDQGLVLEEAIQDFDVLGGDGRYFYTVSVDGSQYAIHARSPDGRWRRIHATFSEIHALADIGDVLYSTNAGIYRNDGDTVDELIWNNDNGRWVYALGELGPESPLACGYGGTLLIGDQQEDELVWRETAGEPGFHHFNILDGNGCDDIWAGEWYGRILHYDGEVWTRETLSLSGTDRIENLQALPMGQVLIWGGESVAMRDLDGVWERIPIPATMGLGYFAMAPDSILATLGDGGVQLWDGHYWRDRGSLDGPAEHIVSTGDGSVYTLTSNSHRLYRWSGEVFEEIAEFPDLQSLKTVHGSRTTSALYVVGWTMTPRSHSVVHRYQDGRIVTLTDPTSLDFPVSVISELRSGLVFVLGRDQVWRYQHDRWQPETGLPTGETLSTIWSHPDCGLFVVGQPTFFKPFPED